MLKLMIDTQTWTFWFWKQIQLIYNNGKSILQVDDSLYWTRFLSIGF